MQITRLINIADQSVRKIKALHAHVLWALVLITAPYAAEAACLDNGDTTFSCTGAGNITDGSATAVNLNTTGGAINFSNITTDAVYGPNFGLQSTISNTAGTVGAASLFNITGNNAVTINNVGGMILMQRTVDFNPAGWSNDANGLLYNNYDGNGPVLAGFAAAITAGLNTPSLTVNTLRINNGVYYDFIPEVGIPSPLNAYDTNFTLGNFTASVFTNAPQFIINSGGYGNIVSYGPGTTTLNFGDAQGNPGGMFGDLYIVDRNPLLTIAQSQDPTLVLAYSAAEVGARNSVINVVGPQSNIAGTGIFLGSGAHLINNQGGDISAPIFVDQRDADVVDVTGGVATVVTSVHGSRTFTLNNTAIADTLGNIVRYGTLGDITLNDVAGAVNTINFNTDAGNFLGNFSANGLGSNTVNLNCLNLGTQGCGISGSTTGFTTYNITGSIVTLNNDISVTDDINVNARRVLFIPSPTATLTANNVVVGSNTQFGVNFDNTGSNNALGNIVGNLTNQGTLSLGDATLNVSGNTNMQSGSKLVLTLTSPTTTGLLNTAGTTTFASDAVILPTPIKIVNLGTVQELRIANGTQYTIATNVAGLPTIQSGSGFLEWLSSTSTGDLVITAHTGATAFLEDKVTMAARNATKAFFDYTGNEPGVASLQAELLKQQGINAIHAAERLRPETNDGSLRAVLNSTDKVFNLLDSRLLSNRSNINKQADNMEPVVTAAAATNTLSDGNSRNAPDASKGIWVQGFGDRGQQQGLNGFDGYNISAAGMAAGADRKLDNDTRVGFAAAYTRSNISNTGNTVNNRIDTNSFLGALYGSKEYDDFYVNAALGVGINKYKSYRRLSTLTSEGDHDSWQFSGRVDAGWPIVLNDRLTVVPTVALDYTHLKESGYKENSKSSVIDTQLINGFYTQTYVNGVPVYVTRDSATNLEIQDRSFDSIRSGLGGKAIYSLQEPTWGAELELHGLYRHEFGDLAQDSVARFTFGSASFNSPGQKPDRESMLLGGSLRMTSNDDNDQITLFTTYDAEMREKYLAQTMSLALRYDFDQASRYKEGAKARLASVQSKKESLQSPLTPSAKVTEQDIAAMQQAMQANLAISTDPAEAAKQQAIDTVIKTWATALSNKNIDVYFNSYAADFVTPDGSTRQQWERKRKAELNKEANPAFKIAYLRIKADGDHALAMFTTMPAGDSHQAELEKVIDLENRNGRWLIVREDSLALAE